MVPFDWRDLIMQVEEEPYLQVINQVKKIHVYLFLFLLLWTKIPILLSGTTGKYFKIWSLQIQLHSSDLRPTTAKRKKKQINPCPVHPFTTFTILFLSEKLKRTGEHCSVPEKSVHTGYFRSKGEMPSEVLRASLLLYQKSASSSFLMD